MTERRVRPSRNVSRYRLGMVVSVLAICALSGCAQNRPDAPHALVSLGNTWGVTIHSATPPFRIESFSDIKPEDLSAPTLRRGRIRAQWLSLAHGCHENWCWKILGVPATARAWRDWHRRHATDCRSAAAKACSRMDWAALFGQVHTVARRLLGRAPSPLNVRLILVPSPDGYRGHAALHNPSAVPLEFGVSFPVDTRAPGFDLQVRRSLVAAMGLLAYEFQHVEYAAHMTAGPTHPRGAKTTKNEANSTCWRLATRAWLAASSQLPITLPVPNKNSVYLLGRMVGAQPDFGNAALWGPFELWHQLAAKLVAIEPDLEAYHEIQVRPKDRRAQQAIVAFCRYYSHRVSGLDHQTLKSTRKGKGAGEN